MKIRWAKRALILLLAVCMALTAACASNNKTEENSAPVLLPTPTPEPQPAQGGELILPLTTNADISDPYKVNTEELLNMFSLIYESLLRPDNTGVLTASLAENWSCDESGKVWTVNLRTGARWHDTNEKLNASDVKYSYDRIVAMAGGSYYSTAVARIESMSVVDETTLKVSMKSAGLCSLYALTFPIVRSGADAYGTPVGTGPYKVESSSGERVTLSANEKWWKQRPYIDKVVFLARDNNETALASFAAGQINMVPTSSVSAGKYREEGVTTVLDVMTQTAELLMLNSRNSLLSDVNVRKALAYAIDRSTIITNIYMNRAHASDVPIAPDSWLYESKSKVYDYNVNKALSLLNEAGWSDVDGDGFIEYENNPYSEAKFTLLVSETTDTLRSQAAELIASQLLDVGIQVEVVAAEFTLGNDECDYITRLNSGDFDMALVGINLSHDGDVSALINYSGSRNYGKHQSLALDTLLSALTTAADEAAYRDAASQFQLRFIDELPFITLYFRLNSIVYSAEIKNVTDAREPDILRNIDKWYINTTAD